MERVSLRTGERRVVRFTMTPPDLGTIEISVGGKPPGFKGALDAATTGVVFGMVQVVK